MPYFSFSLNNNFSIKNYSNSLQFKLNKTESNIQYFSKNTQLWKKLNEKKFSSYLHFVKFEKRHSIKKLGKKILFFLPPNIGLGDAIEYALSIKAILKSRRFNLLGVAFVGRYKDVYIKYFQINNIYEDFISYEELSKYDTHFHFTLEIKDLSHQKYDRKNIEKLITSYFFVSKFREINVQNNQGIKKITIFPVSKSPLRTMSIKLLNNIIDNFYKDIQIEIVFDKKSDISNYIEENINFKNVNITHPKNLKELLIIIENIYFGVFIDSGPLHVAKILNKNGILITSTVGKETLLEDFNNIESFDNDYESFFCKAPCGLVNVFNYNNKIGCYDSLNILKKRILEFTNLKILQRGGIKKEYINLIANPVNCIKNIKENEVIKKIQKKIYI